MVMTFVKKRTIKKCEEIIEIELQRRKTQLNEDNRKQLLTKIIEIVSSAQNEYSDCKIYNLVGYLLDSNYPAASDIERCSKVVKEELQKNNIAFDNNQLIELTKEIMRISWSKGSDYSSKMIRAYTQAYYLDEHLELLRFAYMTALEWKEFFCLCPGRPSSISIPRPTIPRASRRSSRKSLRPRAAKC